MLDGRADIGRERWQANDRVRTCALVDELN